MKTIPTIRTAHPVGQAIPVIPSCLALFVALALPSSLEAEQFPQPETRFSPDVGQPLFPAGNVNIFKQYVLTIPNQSHSVGKSVSIDLLFDTLRFGGSVTGSIGGRNPATDDAAFGFELGLCIGGTADFDLGFQPNIILPDEYPTGLPVPITVLPGLRPDSSFTTEFPPLGKAYADLIFEVGAEVKAEACVFGCTDIKLGFSTCDVPGFAVSTRCDPVLDEKAFCAFELASFNRNDDNCFRLINVSADSVAEFLAMPQLEFCPSLPDSQDQKTFTVNPGDDTVVFASLHPFVNGTQVQVSSSGTLPLGLEASRIYYARDATATTLRLSKRQGGTHLQISSLGTPTHKMFTSEPNEPEEESGGFGDVSIAVPTVSTDSMSSMFNTAEVLKSTGAEDIMKLDIDVAALINAYLPPAPPLSDSGSVGPIDWNYTIASLNLGPAVKLQTDFEMTWDLLVTAMTFTVPGTSTPKAVNITGQNVTALSQVTPAKTYHLTNCGPKALPAIALLDLDPVDVTITYVLKPKLKTVVSIPVVGNLSYEALAAGAGISRVGGVGFGPLIEGAHEFKVGEFTVYDGAPSPIESGAGMQGTINFQMQAAGPAKYRWRPDLISGGTTGHWSQQNPGPSTNWREFAFTNLSSGFPGNLVATDYSVVDFDLSPWPTLTDNREVMALTVGSGRRLDIDLSGASTAALTVGGGAVENEGTINIRQSDILRLDSPDSVLCGTGTLHLEGGHLMGYGGSGDFTFCNYNTITGGSNNVMNQIGRNSGASAINNLGEIMVNEFSITSADRIVNQNLIQASAFNKEVTYTLFGQVFDSRMGSRINAIGGRAVTRLRFDRAEHAGVAHASFGGVVELSPDTVPRATWNAGQSFTNDVGFFRAEGLGGGTFAGPARLDLTDVDMNGGCFVVRNGGEMVATDTNFVGSVLHIGDFNPSLVDETTGIVSLNGGTATDICVTNYGTVRVPGTVSSVGTLVFANHGTVEVPAGGSLNFPLAGLETQPGISNAAGETLVGGTWDIAGTLDIAGATFASIGANVARASTGSGAIDDLGGAARVASGTDEDDLTRVLSLGHPAKVILRGSSASFPALDSVLENRGTIELRDGGAFPTGGGSTAGDFVNLDRLVVQGASSQMSLGGAFIQAGPDAVTELSGGGALFSGTHNFQILGGRVVATSDSALFNRAGTTIPSGTTIRVEAPLLDSDEIDIFTGLPVSEPAPVIVDLDGPQTDVVQITTIQSNATVEIAGRYNQFFPGQAGIHFPAIRFLSSNAGTFRLEGAGFPYSPDVPLGSFTNTGLVELIGSGTRLGTGTYTQNGASSVTRVGAGARIAATDFRINGGEIIVEIGSRPGERRFGKLGVRNNSNSDFGNRLVFDFTGDFTRTDIPTAGVDVGDTWELIPRTVRTGGLTGLDTVGARLGGALLPPGWLPPGTHLELIRFDNGTGGTVGLALRVVPDFGVLEYYDWADDRGFLGVLRDPLFDGSGNGTLNATEFFFGLGDRILDGPMSAPTFVTGIDDESFLEVSYLRPWGSQARDASYTPYYSLDLRQWLPAPMVITAFEAGPSPNEQRVRMQSILPVGESEMFLRMQGDLNPDNFDLGQVPEKPLNWNSGFENMFDPGDPDSTVWKQVVADFNGGVAVDYSFEPGRILFVNVNADADFGSVYGAGIYRDWSNLASAVVHAGLLGDGDNGLVKVTILPRQESFTGTNQNGVASQDYNYSSPTSEPNATSYRLELVSSQTGN